MGLTHLDAGVVIGFLDAGDAHHAAATAALDQARRSGDRLAISASAFAECLVGPARRGGEAVAIVRDLFARLPISIVDLTPEVALRAAEVRACHRSLRLPDALVLATATTERAGQLITTDRRWPPADELDMTMSITVL